MRFMTLCANRLVFIIAILLILFIGLISAQTVTLEPTEDVFIYTFGGGQGGNPFLKYDISSVPESMIIDSVYLTPFIWEVGANWDGDMNYWNVNDQNWTGADSARLIWNLPTSDSTHQASDFGTAMGWTQSVDLKNIFLTDYNASNTYCSIKMKDPDDPTSVPPPGSYPVDDSDSLVAGNILFNEHIIFYPREYVNAPPWLVVYYHPVGVNEEQNSANRPVLQIYPNPFRNTAEISCCTGQSAKGAALKIYNSSGQLIKDFSYAMHYAPRPTHITWFGDDEYGHQVPNGIYFCKIKIDEYTIIKKVCLIR